MKQLAARGKKVILISNSSKRVGTSLKKLDKMGFESKQVTC
jgi:ribonucleotide monophosphatase NagD (HAD superfamily)